MPESASKPVTGEQIARYYERVLGVRRVAAFDLGPAAVVQDGAVSSAVRPLCLLVEVDAGYGSSAAVPSLQVMGSRLLEAIRGEWLKQSADHMPDFAWIQAGAEDWREALRERGNGVILAIVCGAQQSPPRDGTALHIPSFVEMQNNPVQKREAWRAIQAAIHDNRQ